MSKHIDTYFFLGIGGIGMSALARYLKKNGFTVAGYDANKSQITSQLEEEGISVIYTDTPDLLPNHLNPENTLVIITPAIKEGALLNYFQKNRFKIIKRSQLLGEITNNQKLIAIAGTHGKTSTSAITAHILLQADKLRSGFIGGIVKPYNSNLISPKTTHTQGFVVAEADEYDRSFLYLHPDIAVITSIDPDHLDIYNNLDEIKKTFEQFVSGAKQNAKIIINQKVEISIPADKEKYTYGLSDNCDFYADNITQQGTKQHFTLHLNNQQIQTFILFPGQAYLENAVAAAASAYLAGVPVEKIARGLQSYQGTKRRFDLRINNGHTLIYDDYAHHPAEIKALYQSARQAYPNKKLTIIFQPHLYSRTRDFAREFASALELFDNIIITDIYPAREKTIPGITPNTILQHINKTEKQYIPKDKLQNYIKQLNNQIIFVTGAGDVNSIIDKLEQKTNK